MTGEVAHYAEENKGRATSVERIQNGLQVVLATPSRL